MSVLRGDWFRTRGPWQASAGFDLRSVHRLHLQRYWIDEHTYGVALGWGEGGCDPVWYVGVAFPTCRKSKRDVQASGEA